MQGLIVHYPGTLAKPKQFKIFEKFAIIEPGLKILLMNNDPENDEVRQKVDEDGLLEDLADEFTNGDPDDALARAEELGYDIDDLPL